MGALCAVAITASRRNPWNEVECGDHYARSIGYGLFTAASGYEHHGPSFSCLRSANDSGDFRAAFTTSEGWGTYTQKGSGKKKTATLDIKWGKLRLKTFALNAKSPPRTVRASLDGRDLEVQRSN